MGSVRAPAFFFIKFRPSFIRTVKYTNPARLVKKPDSSSESDDEKSKLKRVSEKNSDEPTIKEPKVDKDAIKQEKTNNLRKWRVFENKKKFFFENFLLLFNFLVQHNVFANTVKVRQPGTLTLRKSHTNTITSKVKTMQFFEKIISWNVGIYNFRKNLTLKHFFKKFLNF